ncbi:nitroreductase [Cellulomonas flavigena DSM 20109]|uniref:Nitroreductase n=1 Tax=Cellulomonas flavigena (strain ATCC 482 / DSM 20109 / BCRC 11376 / JCM 18109 / NBRC 3775 / NCIMB 8073 / NRS 134) TaxID=446466 RepID=D5UIR7_CELFN|nr:malonic semialdehyde reductase [Cellulomonas flavigena]ADG75483.1 nitroreductase [Cellulomonas flavigena DSM 20109]
MTTHELLETATPTGVDTAVVDRLFRDARTVGRFTDAPVPDELLQDVYDAVRLGPTAMNTTPLRLLVVRTPDARARLAAHMADFNRDRVLAAPVSIVVAADTDFHEHMATLVPHAPTSGERFAGIPDVRAGMARDGAWLQTGYLVLGLRAAGLGVGPMTGMDAAGIDAELLAGTSWRAIAVLNVGYADGEGTDRPRAPRLTWEQTVRVV